MVKPICFVFIVFCVFNYSFSQEQILSGFVKDSLQQPLESATLIATPKQKKVNITYTTTNALGYYELTLIDSINYTIEVSYLGYKKSVKHLKITENKSNYNFALVEDKEALDEVIIDYKYKAIEKTKDTTTYNLKAFVNGNENKMEDVLAKLPGIKIDGNTIKVQGKTVNKLLVDGKLFFGGGAKLALENLPADVMEKIQIISNYSESELLKNIEDQKDLALNVVLKEDKKKFVFGDIELGYGLDDFYIIHPTLFKYSPKSNISFIGDVNNFNHSSLSFGDLLRLSGGYGNLIKNSNNDKSLFDFAVSNTNKFKSLTRFSALNFHHTFSEKLHIEGFALYSNNDFTNKNETSIEYINENESVFEDRNTLKLTSNNSLSANLKAVFDDSNNNVRFVYGTNYFTNKTDSNTAINSVSGIDNNQFLTKVDGTNTKFSHYIEGLKKVSDKHTLGLSVRQSISNIDALNNWNSDTEFLQDFFPIEASTIFRLKKTNTIQSNNLNILFKDYWLATNYTHFFMSLGFNYKKVKIITNETQILDDNTIIDFSENNTNFGNDLTMNLSDFNTEIGIKSKIGNMTIKAQIMPHYYTLKMQQGLQNTNEKLFLEPTVEINYNLNDDDETLNFFYNYSNKYPIAKRFLRNVTIINFNSVIQGNQNLLDEKSHTFSLDYNNDKSEDFYFYASIDYSIGKPVLKNVVSQVGITQANSSLLLNLQDTSVAFSGEVGKTFNFFDFNFEAFIDWSKTNQIINSVVILIDTYDYNFSTTLLKKISKNSHLKFSHTLNINTVVSSEASRFTEHILALKFDAKLLKNLIFKTDISTYFISDYENVKSNYTIPNIYLNYKKANSKFSYGLILENIFDNDVILYSSFSETVIRSQKTFTLPRALLFKINYKF